MPLLATLLIGFSFLAALLLILVNALQTREYVSKFSGFALIISLVTIQGLNLHFILVPIEQGY